MSHSASSISALLQQPRRLFGGPDGAAHKMQEVS